MISATLLWFAFVPLLCGGAVYWFTGRRLDNIWPALGVSIGGLIVAACAFYGFSAAATSDTEIWNGQITSKERKHGSYTRSYECNCTETCTGTGSNRSCTKTCMTCYEDRYTVTHRCDSTIGSFTIQHLDTTSRSVYNTPDPQRWSIIKVGDPVAKTHAYTNYVQAVPESLFRPAPGELKQRFANLIPKYPDQVYDFYRINRFFSPGYSVPEAQQWSDGISELLKERGPRKQVNAIVVVAKTSDPNYVYALRDAWEGANKNDVVLVIGSAQWPKIDFVDVISWTKNELFKVQLRDNVLALGQVQREPVLGILASQIDTNFERRRMREFEYLKSEIDPPSWLIVTIGLLNALVAAVLVWVLNGKSFTYTPPARFRSRFH